MSQILNIMLWYNIEIKIDIIYKYQLFMSVKVEIYPQGERLDCSISRAYRLVKWTIHLSESLGFLLHSAVWRKTTKNTRTFDLLYVRILNFLGVCVLIFLSLGCNLVMWYVLNKKLWDLFLLFPIPSNVNRKPTWRSRVWWLAKFAWYDVTWNPLLWLSRLPKVIWLERLTCIGKIN